MHDWIISLRPAVLWALVLGLGCGGGDGGTPPAPGTASTPDPAAGPPAPAIRSFTATFNSTPHGGYCMLTAVFAGGTGRIDPDIGPVASGVPVSTVDLDGVTTFTLTVTSAAGARATEAVTVIPQVEKRLFSYWTW